MPFVIRLKNSQEDMDFFNQLEYESFITTLKETDAPEEEKRRKFEDFLKTDPIDPEGSDHFIYIVEDENGNRCGLIWIYNREPFWRFVNQHVWIYNLHILPKYRGQGLAKRLLLKIEEYAQKQNLSIIALHVLSFNTKARHLYESLGYKLVATHNESCFYEKNLEDSSNYISN